MAIKSSERTALTRILNNRFDILESELEQRRHELEIVIRDRVMEEAHEQIVAAEAEVRDVENAVREAMKVLPAIVAKYRKHGIQPGSYYVTTDVIGTGKNHREIHRIRTWDDGRRAGQRDLMSLSVSNAWTPINPQGRIDDELRKLTAEKGRGVQNLRKLRAELEEKILLGQVESEDAKDLLGQIPDVDDLLPPASDVKALTQKGAAV